MPPGTCKIYYLRCLLNKVRGTYIRIVDGIEYESFRDACYVRGLIGDDKENVNFVNEASQ